MLAKVSDVRYTVPMIKAPEIPTTLTTALRDAAYMTIGLGVVAVEQLQARRHRLTNDLDKRIDVFEERVEAVVDRIEKGLPEQAEHLFGQARGVTKVARDRVRALIRPAA